MYPLFVTAALAAYNATALRPNIVWIMSDDLGWGEPGSYPSTSPHGRIATPHIDAMAAEGMRFTDAYAGYTVCAPSRTTFFTGRHSGNFVKYGYSGTALPPSPSVLTTAALLKRAGYQTGASGKIAPLLSPMRQGFDRFLGQVSQTNCHDMYPSQIAQQINTTDPAPFYLPLNKKERNRRLCMAHPEQYNYTTDVFYNDAIEWVKEVATDPRPFFLYLAFTVPHAGGWNEANIESGAPVPTDLQYANKDWPDVEKDHAATITYMDRYVGNLFSTLRTLGVDNNTIVFFASDNGAHQEGGHKVAFFNSTGGLRGYKRSLYEGGVRSPTIARWPGKIPAGTVSSTQWAFWDAMPTFAELAGVSSSVPRDIDGVSIVESLLHGTQQHGHDYLFFTWDGAGTNTADAKRSGYGVRMGNWKAVVPYCGDGNTPSSADAATMQLYDLSVDPFEQQNVAAQHTSEVRRILDFVISKNLSCQCYQC